MEYQNTNQNTPKTPNDDKYFVGIRFNESGKSYFFSTNEKMLKMNDRILVETSRGTEIGMVAILPMPMEGYKLNLELKSIIRVATDEDIKTYESNKELAKQSYQTCVQEIKRLGLDMNLTSCEYTLDRTKVIFAYLADERVDFRELLKALASKLRCRIELRQIGTRDKAKLIGGIGVCGLPLCCTTFLNEFDGISINRAKNQMLTLNIPKLSGHCGKLICCLKYEDDAYSDLKKDFPRVGLRFNYNGLQYRISSINVITRTIKIENPDDVQFISLDEIKKYLPKEEN